MSPLFGLFAGQAVKCWPGGSGTSGRISPGKRILDFGSGSGIAAIAAALSGAREVIALDTDPLSRGAILANAELNKVTIATTDNLAFVRDDFDVILAADILYDRNNFQLLDIFNERSKRVVVADSRVKELPEPYEKIGYGTAVTCPDLDEPKEYRHVGYFCSKSSYKSIAGCSSL